MAQVAVRDSSAASVRDVLRKYWGFDELRPLQGEAIAAGVGRPRLAGRAADRRRQVALLPGAAAAVAGRTDVVVSPLISLMKDQVDALSACGYPAAALHSGMSRGDERREIRRAWLPGTLSPASSSRPSACSRPASSAAGAAPERRAPSPSTRRTASASGATTSGPSTASSPSCTAALPRREHPRLHRHRHAARARRHRRAAGPARARPCWSAASTGPT